MNVSDASEFTRNTGDKDSVRVAFRFHSRVLAALGRDLVTNDVVAVMELVKNAYDALATQVEVRICPEARDEEGPSIEIIDNGQGMDHTTIVDVWCVIATPFRQERPISKTGRYLRAVTGEKGLGRLSAARLGRTLSVVTKARNSPVLEFSLDWDEMMQVDDLADAAFEVSRLPPDAFEGQHGTLIRIDGLRSTWDKEKIDDLRENLVRLVSPFSTAENFALSLNVVDLWEEPTLRITAPEFMTEPKYAIEGCVDADRTIQAQYRYRPVGRPVARERSLSEEWTIPVPTGSLFEASDLSGDRPSCGPFQFEIRAWDLTKDDTRDIAEHFDETRQRIRDLISSQRGISVYRDDVLVLPKSEDARDWLGLDIRRVSRIGPRLSTSQVVGYVRITKEDNPGIVDTSDREGIVSSAATATFRGLILRIVELLEVERHTDRLQEKDTDTAKELFANLSADPLVTRLEDLRKAGGGVSDAIEVAKDFGQELERSRADIERRFGYYNRLAVIGTIAQMVIHEIRNRTTVIGRGLRKAGELADRVRDSVVGRALGMAKESVTSLEALADRFAPLASRGYRPGRRTSVVEESIDRCLAMQKRAISACQVAIEAPSDSCTAVRIDPGEIDAVILNLLANALYWLQRYEGERKLRFSLTEDLTAGRVTVSIDDSGPGIDPEDRERVFWPGVTRKPDGFGMGLTVASELVDGHGGKMKTIVPGDLGGATFQFDLPLVEKACEARHS
ncbi:MAG: sensor histidine kinase [Caldilineaceae bacterium]|nr:sensor histidine kinase [Caldilineaceae bacterium]